MGKNRFYTWVQFVFIFLAIFSVLVVLFNGKEKEFSVFDDTGWRIIMLDVIKGGIILVASILSIIFLEIKKLKNDIKE